MPLEPTVPHAVAGLIGSGLNPNIALVAHWARLREGATGFRFAPVASTPPMHAR
ncbi:MAG: hypothetical protein ABJC74_09315 [Gemmatimonadota bacterium]